MPKSTDKKESLLAELKRTAKRHAWVLLGFLGVCVVLEIVDVVGFNETLDAYGIRPREPLGLLGILWAPLHHGSVSHLLSNSVPFLVLGWFVLVRGYRVFAFVTAMGWIGGGLLVWCVGAENSSHVGASGLVFTYFGYTLLAGWFQRRFWPIVISVVVLLLFGGLLFGLLSAEEGVSWEGHVFGFVFGVLAAWGVAFWTKRQRRRAEEANGEVEAPAE